MRESITARPVAECTADLVADTLTRAFEGYIVPVAFTATAYERRFRAEHLDPYASRVYFDAGEAVGLVLVARRGWTARIAGMGFVPAARGRGLGRRALSAAIDEAAARGDRTLVLEVFEENAPAVGLYAALGFGVRRRLVGYRLPPGGAAGGGAAADAAAAALVEVDPSEMARVAQREGEPGLPWMLAPETLAGATPPARAFRLDDAFALVGDTAGESIALHAVVVPRERRRQGCGTRLLRALAGAFPGRSWFVPPIVPEGMAERFFTHLGWERLRLAQYEMALALDEA